MLARRLIAVPTVTLLAILVAGAVVDAGRQARHADAATDAPLSTIDDPAARAELVRIETVLDAARTCAGGVACSAEVAAANVRRSIVQVGTWGDDQRFSAVRDRTIALLTIRADQLDQLGLGDRTASGILDRRARTAERDLVRAQLAAGLIDRATSRARLAALD